MIIAIAVGLAFCADAAGQRLRFAEESVAGPSSSAAAGIDPAPELPLNSSGGFYSPPGGSFTTPGTMTAPSTMGSPSMMTAPSTMGTPSAGSGAFAPGSAPLYAPGGVVQGPYGPSPSPLATFQGDIGSPGYNPYATPGEPYSLFGDVDPLILPDIPGETAKLQRFREALTFHYLWIPRVSDSDFGVNDFDFQAKFAFPCSALGNIDPETGRSDSPLYVSPGFALHLWDGPAGQAYDMPPRVFDAYVEFEYNPIISPVLAAELAFRVGAYSDFEKVTSESLRYTGRAVGALVLSDNYLWLKGGIIYYDREKTKMLPTAGLVIMPSSDMRLDLMFPDPKISFRYREISMVEYWIYFRGAYGGGSWTINQPSGIVATDYNDIRIALGVDFENKASQTLDGYFEIGGSFDRELYSNGAVWSRPSAAVFLGAGLKY